MSKLDIRFEPSAVYPDPTPAHKRHSLPRKQEHGQEYDAIMERLGELAHLMANDMVIQAAVEINDIVSRKSPCPQHTSTSKAS